MVVLRRLDTLLEPTKEKVLEEVALLELTEMDLKELKDASDYVFYDTSQWILKQLYTDKAITLQKQ